MQSLTYDPRSFVNLPNQAIYATLGIDITSSTLFRILQIKDQILDQPASARNCLRLPLQAKFEKDFTDYLDEKSFSINLTLKTIKKFAVEFQEQKFPALGLSFSRNYLRRLLKDSGFQFRPSENMNECVNQKIGVISMKLLKN